MSDPAESAPSLPRRRRTVAAGVGVLAPAAACIGAFARAVAPVDAVARAVACVRLRAGALGRAALAAGVAAATALHAPAVPASPLGPLTAQSLRGEPLRAVVELTGSDPPAVRLAAPAAYARFGLVHDPALARITLRPELARDGKRFLRLETDGPVDAAELVLLLEGGGTRRAYRLRLDSPEPADRVGVRGVEPLARLGGAEPARDPAAAPGPGARPAETASVRGAPEPGAPAAGGSVGGDGAVGSVGAAAVGSVERPAGRSVERPDQAAAAGPAAGPGAAPAPDARADPAPVPIAPPARPDAVEVAAGDTLDALARALRPPGATTEQSALALWRANPRSFFGRPPRPIAGTRLTVPSEADVLAIEAAEARAWAGSAGALAASQGGGPVAGAGGGRTGDAPLAGAASLGGAAAAVAPTGVDATRSPAPDAVPSATRAPVRVQARAQAGTESGRGPEAPRPPAAAPGTSPPRPASAGFDAELAETLRRTRDLERRVAALKAGFEATARREEATMRALIDATRGGSGTSPRASR